LLYLLIYYVIFIYHVIFRLVREGYALLSGICRQTMNQFKVDGGMDSIGLPVVPL